MKKEWHLTLSDNTGKIIRQIKGFNAYDSWHFLVRTKEILSIQNLEKKIKSKKYKFDNFFSQLPRKDKFLFLYFSILASKSIEIFELGSSSCEFIDGINLLKKITNQNIKLQYYGLDHSKLMNQIAKKIHPKENLMIYENLNQLKKLELKNFFLHDYGVSNYIFKDTKKFAQFMNEFNCGYSQMLFSKGNTIIRKQPSGKEITFFSLPEFKKYYKYNIYFLFPTSSVKKWSAINKINKNSFISGYFFFSRKSKDINKLKRYLNSSTKIKNYCKEINLQIKNLNDSFI
mgnify:CR=1 FL=1